MQINRRTLLRLFAQASGALFGAWLGFGRAEAQSDSSSVGSSDAPDDPTLSDPLSGADPTLGDSPFIAAPIPFGTPVALNVSQVGTRPVLSADASALQTIMASSVRDTSSFFGKCGDWSLSWAADLVTRCPDTVVVSAGTTPVAFMELPPIRPALSALASDASADEQQQYAVRVRNRTTFRVTAAGVRDDLLTADQSVRVFRTVLYNGFVRARQLGYAAVEAVAPWEQHPRMSKKWTDYPGCALVEPVSRNQGSGKDLYWLRWNLDDAITALAAEGATGNPLNAAS